MQGLGALGVNAIDYWPRDQRSAPKLSAPAAVRFFGHPGKLRALPSPGLVGFTGVLLPQPSAPSFDPPDQMIADATGYEAPNLCGLPPGVPVHCPTETARNGNRSPIRSLRPPLTPPSSRSGTP